MKPDAKPFLEMIGAAGLPELVADAFCYYYQMLCRGTTGEIPEESIEPLGSDAVVAHGEVEGCQEEGVRALSRTVAIKLNGGLGTTMGLDCPKCLLGARDGLTFLEIAVRQVRTAEGEAGTRVPMLLMNSFVTEATSLVELAKYGDVSHGLPPSFVQHHIPKVLANTLAPARWPANPALEWNPPGHGDIYAALSASGLLDALVKRGYRYAFVSNIDNLGATLDTSLLGYFAAKRLPFMMEVVRRTPMHRKGGHLARLRDSRRLVLRELAQVSPDELALFQDIERHQWFNSNNIWVDLEALSATMRETRFLKLPLIRNDKLLDPRDPLSPPVHQIETAMGAAISLFEGAEAVAVPTVRYLPVKRTEDLLVMRSDRFIFTGQGVVTPNPAATPTIEVTLDSHHYGKYDDLESRFPEGVPSLAACDKLSVLGDVLFRRGVRVVGEARITNEGLGQGVLKEGTEVTGDFVVR